MTQMGTSGQGEDLTCPGDRNRKALGSAGSPSEQMPGPTLLEVHRAEVGYEELEAQDGHPLGQQPTP